MNIAIAARFVVASAAVGLAAGCAGGSPIVATPATHTSLAVAGAAGRIAASTSPSGRLVRNAPHVRPEVRRRLVHYARAPKDLFVALQTDVATYQNKTWNEVGTFSASGMACPDGDWFDKKGNFYVADWACYSGGNVPGVYEFKRGSNTPSFVYTTGLVDPVNARTDRDGNVYVTDFYGGYIDEYRHGSNSLLYQCAPPNGYGLVSSATIDRNGNVFMTSMSGDGPYTAYLYKYAGGLKGCSAELLATFPFFPGGMVMDKNQNLILPDQVDDVVDVIPPPYTTIGSQISAPDAFMATINKNNDQIYVTSWDDPGVVYIDAYPSGSNIATLDTNDGVTSETGGAVDALNYIP